MPYTLHPSEKLVALFKEKPWQGCDPTAAQFLFVGLDANYAADIETSLPEVFDYLYSGEEFWRRTKVHHPFRLPKYKGSGKRYHDKFEQIGFTPEHAGLCLSLNCCTCLLLGSVVWMLRIYLWII